MSLILGIVASSGAGPVLLTSDMIINDWYRYWNENDPSADGPLSGYESNPSYNTWLTNNTQYYNAAYVNDKSYTWNSTSTYLYVTWGMYGPSSTFGFTHIYGSTFAGSSTIHGYTPLGGEMYSGGGISDFTQVRYLVSGEIPSEFTSLVPPPLASGGEITEADGYIVHSFTSSDNFTVLAESLSVEYLIVGAGGPGGYSSNSNYAGSGGAGGWVHSTATLNAGNYPVVVGSGSEVYQPAPGLSLKSGRPSTFNGAIAYGGGAGGDLYSKGGDSAGLWFTSGEGGTAMGSGGGNGSYMDSAASGGVVGMGYTNGGFGVPSAGVGGAGGGAAGNASLSTPGNSITTMGIEHSKGGFGTAPPPTPVPPYGRGGSGTYFGAAAIDGGIGIVAVRYLA